MSIDGTRDGGSVATNENRSADRSRCCPGGELCHEANLELAEALLQRGCFQRWVFRAFGWQG